MRCIIPVLAALLFSVAADAQPYPSPVVNNITVQGAVSGAGATATFGNLALPNAGVTTVAITCNGTNDNSAALQAILNQPDTIGILPAGGVCTFRTPLVSTASNNGLQCAVGTTSYGPSCQLKYTGTAGGKMISFITSSTAANRLNGSQVKGIQLDGNGLAADGIYGEGLYGFHFDDVTLTGFNSGYAVDIEPVQVAASSLTSGDSTTSQDGTIDNLTVNNGTPFTSGGVKAGYFPGGTNTSINLWQNWTILVGPNSTGFYCAGCDGIEVDMSRFFGSSTVPSIDLSCGGSGSTLNCANGVVFDRVQANGGITARGTASFACTAWTLPQPSHSCTYYNEIRNIDTTNGTQNPVIEAGANMHFNNLFGLRYGDNFYGKDAVQPGAIFADDLGDIIGCTNNALTNGIYATAYICNASAGALAYYDNLGGSRYYVRMNNGTAAANLVFAHPAGTGIFEFGQTIQTDGGLLPLADLGQNIGLTSQRYNIIEAKTLASNNGTNIWAMDLGIGATGDGNVTFAHNGIVRLTLSSGSPAIFSGFGGSGAAITTSSSARAFSLAIGTTPTTTGSIAFPYAAAHFWTCQATNITAMAADRTSSIFVFESAHADTTHATFTFYSSAMALAAPTAADEIDFMCQDY